jgi:septal ring factor EnvC (AmiA/AmiB activator)
VPTFVLRDDMTDAPGFESAHTFCSGCGQTGDGPYVDLGIGPYGSDYSQRQGVGYRYLCRACIARIAQVVGFVPMSLYEQEAAKSADLDRRLQAADAQAQQHYRELSPYRDEANQLKLKLADSESQRRDAETLVANMLSGEAEHAAARERMHAMVIEATAENGEARETMDAVRAELSSASAGEEPEEATHQPTGREEVKDHAEASPELLSR